MSTLISGYITLEKLEQIIATVKKKGEKGFKFTASISERSNQYGQNIGYFAEQTKEQRDAKTDKWYFGNGKVFWTDGKIEVAKADEVKEPDAPIPGNAPDDLPF